MKRLARISLPLELKNRTREVLGDIKNGTIVDCVYNRLLYNNIIINKLDINELKTRLPECTKDYQLDDLSKSLNLQNVFNINKPGYGKTFETIQWIKLILKGHCDILILCPKSVIDTWIFQLNKYYPNWNEEHNFMITNYEQLYSEKRFKPLSLVSWDLVVLDESHKIKSMKSKITRLVFQLNSRYKHCLTGTPIKNRPEDIASQLKWLDNNSITNYTDFQLAFCDIIRDQWGFKPNGLTKDKKMVENLQKLLDLYCIGGEEQDVTVPPEHIKIKLKMDDKVKKLYKEVEGEYDKELKMRYVNTEKLLSEGIKVSSPIESAIRRQQLTSNPQLFNPQLKNVKFEWILDWLNGTDEKVVILSRYAKTIEQLEMTLNEAKVNFRCIKSSHSSSQRLALRSQFIKLKNVQVLMGTFGVMKEGIDGLQESCHYMIFVDREWNGSDNEQAEKRINRTGQSKQCIFYILQCVGSIDIRVENVQSKKIEDVEKLLEPVTEEESYEQ